MNTVLFDFTRKMLEKDVKKIIKAFKKGEIIAFPTETVYGLGGNAFNVRAIESIYRAKNRPFDNPLILHIGRKQQIYSIVEGISKKDKILIERFWPGPLTIVFKKKKNIFNEKLRTGETVAVRMTNNSISSFIFSQGNLIIAAPSANMSGKPSATTAKDVLVDLKNRIWGVIDGGKCEEGIESTIISTLEDPPVILRPGSITKEEIENNIGKTKFDESLLKKHMFFARPIVPGMKYKHYAPKGVMIVIQQKTKNVMLKKKAREENVEKKKICVICFKENTFHYKESQFNIMSLGSKYNLKEIFKNFYIILRKCDKLKIDLIFIESFKKKKLGFSYMNRVEKAAGYNYLLQEKEKK